jgi:hypothetical protein
MQNFFPSRLIVVRRYATRELAEDDRDELLEAGIPAYVKRGYIGESVRVLMVGEENLAAAIALLAESDPEDSPQKIPDEALQCTRCNSRDVAPLPPYAALTFAAGAAAATTAFVSAHAPAVAPLLGATILISTVVYVKSPRWRCRLCGFTYGRPRRGRRDAGDGSRVPSGEDDNSRPR